MRRLLALLTCISVASPTAIAADFDFAAATNQLGLDLYRTVATSGAAPNLVLSPYSIESALALVHAGADGATRAELSRVLGLPSEDDAVSAAIADMRRTLEDLAEDSRRNAEVPAKHGGRQDVIEWRAANRLFGQNGYAFRDSFLSLMNDRYAAPFATVDFRANPQHARSTINAWVEEQTARRIRALIPPDGVETRTRLVLVNALYLKAPWPTPFTKSATRPRAFHLSAEQSREVPTMQRTAFLGYAAEDGATIVTLDYAGNGLQFVIVLPDEGTSPDALAAKLTPADFARWAKLGHGKRTNVALSLPKFRQEGATLPLGRALRELGIRSAFDEPARSANFDRIAPRKPDDYLALSEVFHQTFIAVDEEGTEAAAATAAVMLTFGAVAMPSQPIEVRVDRPFLFAIQHRASGACLFLGRIADPR